MPGARVAAARPLPAEDAVGGGPVLIAQCDTRLLLSDVKLVLLEVLPADAPVTVLRHLGLDDEEVRTVALADLDRDVDPDHLTALLVDSGVSAAARELVRLLGLAERLRRPGGCPWDADQTHHSLTRYLLEEAYEVVEAVEALPPDAPAGDVPDGAYRALEDELGDLLYQVIFHAELRTGDGRDLEAQLGDLLAAAIVLARSGGVDAESALRGWAVRFRRRFEAMERLAEARQLELPALTPAAVVALWIETGGEA